MSILSSLMNRSCSPGDLRRLLVPYPDHPASEERALLQHDQPGAGGGADRGADPGLHEFVRQPHPVRFPLRQLPEGLPQGDRLPQQEPGGRILAARPTPQPPHGEQDGEGDHPQQRHLQAERQQRHSLTDLTLLESGG